jgi:hypothetical protein
MLKFMLKLALTLLLLRTSSDHDDVRLPSLLEITLLDSYTCIASIRRIAEIPDLSFEQLLLQINQDDIDAPTSPAPMMAMEDVRLFWLLDILGC